MHRKTNIAYELPSTVKSLNDNWLTTYQCSAILAVAFAEIEIHLLLFVKDDTNFQQDHLESPARHAFLILTYCALFLFIGAAVSGLILTDEFGELPVRASRRSNLIQRGLSEKGSLDLLQSYGAKQSSVWVIFHWLFSLIAGVVSLLAQVLLYVILEDPTPAAKITLSVVGLYTMLPLLHFLPRPWGSNRGNNVVGNSLTIDSHRQFIIYLG